MSPVKCWSRARNVRTLCAGHGRHLQQRGRALSHSLAASRCIQAFRPSDQTMWFMDAVHITCEVQVTDGKCAHLPSGPQSAFPAPKCALGPTYSQFKLRLSSQLVKHDILLRGCIQLVKAGSQAVNCTSPVRVQSRHRQQPNDAPGCPAAQSDHSIHLARLNYLQPHAVQTVPDAGVTGSKLPSTCWAVPQLEMLVPERWPCSSCGAAMLCSTVRGVK